MFADVASDCHCFSSTPFIAWLYLSLRSVSAESDHFLVNYLAVDWCFVAASFLCYRYPGFMHMPLPRQFNNNRKPVIWSLNLPGVIRPVRVLKLPLGGTPSRDSVRSIMPKLRNMYSIYWTLARACTRTFAHRIRSSIIIYYIFIAVLRRQTFFTWDGLCRDREFGDMRADLDLDSPITHV